MNLLQIAIAQLGVKEIAGDEHNPVVLKYAEETGIQGIDTDEIPWCSTFVNWCAFKAGLPKSEKPNARSWLHVGKSTSSPTPGDVVVFWREALDSWKGHVGIFFGYSQDGTKVFCLGGNQGNQVSIQAYDAAKVLDFRRLEKQEKLTIPSTQLKKGDKGIRVTQLQQILNFLKYNCGDADGDFGGKTDKALRFLQANHQVKIDGIYGNGSKTLIESLLQE